MKKLKTNQRALCADLLDIELDILAKGEELAELKKPLKEVYQKWQRGEAKKHGMLGELARCKAECSAKEREIKE